MIVRSGNAASFLVEFSSGQPDGNLDWTVLGPDGATLDSGTVVIAIGDVSAVITVPALDNTLGVGDLSSYRDVTWSYLLNSEIQNDERRYVVEVRVPFGVSPDGVRAKLGAGKQDLPNDDISLVAAYLRFASLVSVSDFPDGTYDDAAELTIRNAIEALAALSVLSTMQVRVALQESSGTDTFKRDKIDWEAIRGALGAEVADAILVLVPGFDLTVGFGAIFVLAPPAGDPIIGTAR